MDNFEPTIGIVNAEYPSRWGRRYKLLAGQKFPSGGPPLIDVKVPEPITFCLVIDSVPEATEGLVTVRFGSSGAMIERTFYQGVHIVGGDCVQAHVVANPTALSQNYDIAAFLFKCFAEPQWNAVMDNFNIKP